MDQELTDDLPFTTYRLAEQYQIGQLLALYRMHPWWVRFCRIITHILLILAIGVVLFLLMLLALFLFFILHNQTLDWRGKTFLALPGLICGFMGVVGSLIARNMITRKIPATLLVCTEGLLMLYPKTIDVTYWSEVRGILQGSEPGESKKYKLNRLRRKPLLIGKAFENTDGLADLIRQQMLKMQK